MGERIDKKHRFMLRIEKGLHHENEALCLRHEISMNLLINEMIRFAKSSQTFQQFLSKQYPVDDRHGHFVFIRREP